MSYFTSTIPESNIELRHRLYSGEIFCIPASSESIRLVDACRVELVKALGDQGDYRLAQFRLTASEHFETVGKLRKQFYLENRFQNLLARVVHSFGFSMNENGFDAARLRTVNHDGHLAPAAAPLYYGHRDTWYANPESMITWWLPLHDVEEAETFEFFPEEFSKSVPNDSEIFDFDEWISIDQKKLIGWQDQNTGLTARYPRLLEEPRSQAVGIKCNAGDTLLFAGQHLHRTHKQTTGKTRFSLDFRTAHSLDTKNGVGPRNVDNRSRGSWHKKFLRFSSVMTEPDSTHED